MRIRTMTAVVFIVLGGCDGREKVSEPLAIESAPTSGGQAPTSAAAPPTSRSANAPPSASVPPARWDLQSSGEGVALALMPASGRAAIRLFCPADAKTLLVNVPAFRPIVSEERLSLGSGGVAVALVADPRGDRERGGVSAAGKVPNDLAKLVAGPLSASYGAQVSGPHPVPPVALSRDFVSACRETAAASPVIAARPAVLGNPCLVQDGRPLRAPTLRAVGTEPFWGARIEGRCINYSQMEDPNGTRIWTRFTPGPRGDMWTGALDGRPFTLRTRVRPGCSDGMSDASYALAVVLTVNGERRSGCAEAIPPGLGRAVPPRKDERPEKTP